ncbi:MAG: TrbI/VirB10 family protein [Sphingomonadales bacterium]|jgi:type IV secretion system protein VirB10
MDEQSRPAELPDDGLPIVGSDRGNGPLWAGAVAIALLAVVLFVAMEGRRQKQLEPAIAPTAADDANIQAYRPPPLKLPDPPAEPPAPKAAPEPAPAPALTAAPVSNLPQTYFPPPNYQPPAYQPPPPAAANPPQNAQASVIVYDVSAAEAAPSSPATAGAPAGAASSKTPAPAFASRGRASRLTTTVPRGTLIPAVLETALDSTQPGQARALISEDVYNLNRDRVLIPRGSRLFGEYRADIAAGQKRAFVQWNELIRPDGAIIAIESPATDPLGRAGVRGKVNSHFAPRLGGALLQSAIDFGAVAATRSLSGGAVIIANPLQAGTSQLVGPLPKPTLSVRQGAKISVLVSRDLEFSPVEPPQ